MDPATVMRKLTEIEEDLAERQNGWEEAAREAARAKREFELAQAVAYEKTDRDLKVDDRKAAAVVALKRSGALDEIAAAESAHDAARAVSRVLETRASIGQSILRAMGRA